MYTHVLLGILTYQSLDELACVPRRDERVMPHNLPSKRDCLTFFKYTECLEIFVFFINRKFPLDLKMTFFCIKKIMHNTLLFTIFYILYIKDILKIKRYFD